MPVTFSDGFLVWATPVATVPIFEDVRLMCSISNNQEFTLAWWSTNNITQLVFNWLAMGEVSLG